MDILVQNTLSVISLLSVLLLSVSCWPVIDEQRELPVLFPNKKYVLYIIIIFYFYLGFYYHNFMQVINVIREIRL